VIVSEWGVLVFAGFYPSSSQSKRQRDAIRLQVPKNAAWKVTLQVTNNECSTDD